MKSRAGFEVEQTSGENNDSLGRCMSNAGVLLDGGNIRETAVYLYDRIVRTVNGEYHVRNEVNKYFEIGIFKQGITI